MLALASTTASSGEAGLALPLQLLGYDPALLSQIQMLQRTLANDVELCGETRSAVVAAWAPTSSWQINKRVAYRADGSTLYTQQKPSTSIEGLWKHFRTSRSWSHVFCSPVEYQFQSWLMKALHYHSICSRLASQCSSILISHEIARQRSKDADRRINSPGRSSRGVETASAA
jgi:hypothetical protein